MYQDNYTYPYVDKYGRGYFMDQSGYAYYVDNNGVSRYLEPMTFLNKWFYKVNHLTAAWRILIHIFITPIVVVGNISLQAAWGLIKNLPMTIKKTRDFNEAIITQGGIDVNEINPSTMESKKIKGLYFAGEVIDIDALTGGYNLQLAFSTGHLAGVNASINASI